MKKIAITGSQGSGKTTLACHLRSILNLDVLHLDSIFSKPEGNRTSESECKRIVENTLACESWIVEGDGDGSITELIYDRRFSAADMIIFLDFPPSISLWRAIEKYIGFKNKTRSSLPSGIREDMRKKGVMESLKGIWHYGQHQKPLVKEKINHYCAGKRIIILRSPVEVQQFLELIGRIQSLSNLRLSENFNSNNPAGKKFVPYPAT